MSFKKHKKIEILRFQSVSSCTHDLSCFGINHFEVVSKKLHLQFTGWCNGISKPISQSQLLLE
jgi:hypothetical protein